MLFSKSSDAKLKEAFEIYNEEFCKTLPTDEELADIIFSEEFEKRMQKLLRLCQKPYYNMINTVGKRAAIIVISVLIMLSGITFGVRAIRETVIEFITETYEKFTRITVDNEDEPEEIYLVPTQPQYVPEGYDVVSNNDSGAISTTVYENKTGQSIYYIQQVNNDTDFHANTEDINYETVYINDLEGIMYDQNGDKYVIFASSDYLFTLSGNISFDELTKMAESIEIN